MVEVALDTSFLITLADPGRTHHEVAVRYFRYFVANKVPMYVSAICAGEFAIKQALEDLPLQNLRLRAYDVLHAKRSALLYNLNRQSPAPDPDGTRHCIINDLKVLAQAAEDKLAFVLTEDRNTLAKIIQRFKVQGLIDVDVILLKDGFNPRRLHSTPEDAQIELLPSPPDLS